jgi:putative N6-adenine-specific DNA methylase
MLTQLQCFAVCAPGLEPYTERELRALGFTATAPIAGGVQFHAPLTGLYLANLWLRTASRVLVRLGAFHAAAFSELRKKAARLEWERWLAPGRPIVLHVTCHKSKLYHSGGVAERVAGAIADRLGTTSPVVKVSEDDGPGEAQLVVVRLAQDLCTISLDSSGDLLHRRGYRLAAAKAPLRETLAAGMLLASGWDRTAPLLDPFCGSGTIAIEAALLARGLAPGRARAFAFMGWPGFDADAWQTALAFVGARPAVPRPNILASDRDAGAIESARANAERAGVADDIEFSRRAVSAITPPAGPGWVVTNPPYGVRVSEGRDLRDLYAGLGQVLREKCLGWQVALLSASPQLERAVGLSFKSNLMLSNGGLKVRLARARVE